MCHGKVTCHAVMSSHVIPQMGAPSLCQLKGHVTVTLTISKFSKDISNYFLNMNNVEMVLGQIDFKKNFIGHFNVVNQFPYIPFL